MARGQLRSRKAIGNTDECLRM